MTKDRLVERLGARASRVAERTFPDPFVFAIVLTFATGGLALSLTPARPLDAVRAWAGPNGLFGSWILKFALQMCLVLVTGHALASTPLVSRAIAALARRPRTAGGAAAMIAAVSVGASYLNWALGLIAGALLARAAGASARTRGVRIHYPLAVAAAYSGLMTWHGGLSGSAPLSVTRIEDMAGLVGPEIAAKIGPISLLRTTGSALNLAVSGGLLLFVPLLFYFLAPRRPEAMREAPDSVLAAMGFAEPARERPLAPGERLDRSLVLGWALAAAVGVHLFLLFRRAGLAEFDLNAVIATFLFLGLLLHGTPIRYVRAVEEAARGCAGIILQFPFYGGIMGLMQGTGLADVFAGWANAVSTPRTLPLVTFGTACLINVFVPSGGGQWAVQGPVVLKAALALGVAPEKVVMALAYGDEITNMLQPFWALPLLALTGLRAGDIMGYTMVVMALSLPLYAVPLLLF